MSGISIENEHRFCSFTVYEKITLTWVQIKAKKLLQQEFLPCNTGHVATLHREKELFLLEGEDAHLSMRPGLGVLLSHPVNAVALKQKLNFQN